MATFVEVVRLTLNVLGRHFFQVSFSKIIFNTKSFNLIFLSIKTQTKTSHFFLLVKFPLFFSFDIDVSEVIGFTAPGGDGPGGVGGLRRHRSWDPRTLLIQRVSPGQVVPPEAARGGAIVFYRLIFLKSISNDMLPEKNFC